MKAPNTGLLKKDLWVAWRFLSLTHSISRNYIPLVIFSSAFKAAAPFINIIMPRFILNELMGSQRIEVFILLVGIVVFGNGVFNLINRFFDTKIDIANVALVNGFELHLGKHIMNLDFEKIEDPEVLDQKEKALFTINNQGAIWRMIGSIINLVQTSMSIVGLIAIVSTLNAFLLVIILSIVLINSFIFKKSQAVQFKFYQELIPINRRIGYYISLTSDFSIAKDVRIYSMSPYILRKQDDYIEKIFNGFGKLFGINGKYEGLSNINLQIQMIVVYSYMVWQVFKNAITIGDFTMYVSAASSFSTNVSAFLAQFIEFRQMCRYLDLYLQFEGIPSRVKTGTRKIQNMDNITVEFKNVWFKYPRSNDYALKDVSIKIENGQKLAIVGQNGAGKTTFIKLLCRLYEPERGEILLNGINIQEFDFNEYMKLLSVVFQDYKLFSFTIKENLVFNQPCDEEALIAALKKVGIYDKIQSLEYGVDTSLYKNFDKKGVELSGGEMQKLAIARALYKNSPIVILDEPTAALDPYAEFEIYSKFNELVKNKTAIYISHRLSSCKFCDKIAVFDNGRLVEYGTHAELEKAGGIYSTMWKAQAQYYV
ncbi:ATP-binding cassette subfamily B protein/ATP-binding cassette subfamily C protein [Caldicoprobacter guelmensis]|uniref:ABC transporter ATP-binding protein n=1 Tax=Caldicoprobacter guelmensis TaxID=1170224 RepID=UPI001959F204|nr:ABC transporter ATP-binding protein [Caldicoprobacter guelmensis]MBM7582082.1 ATP-binding cassette subfamily B protein/ATP-binding cassette subfamily C protein [Caldicoprobacter guelmensis]